MEKIIEGRVSIILPVYNGDKYIERCIESIKSQSYSDIEVFVIDDGSTDDTSEYAKRAIGDDYRFDLIMVDNGGVSEARNLGLRLSNGEYVTFADVDDVLDRDHISNMVRLLNRSGTDIAVTRYTRFKDDKELKDLIDARKNSNDRGLDSNTIESNRSDIDDNNMESTCSKQADDANNMQSSHREYILDKEDSIMEIMKDAKYSGYVWNKIFRHSLIKPEIGACNDISSCKCKDGAEIELPPNLDFDLDLHMCEDLYFCVQAFLRAEKVAFSEVSSYYYYDNMDGITKGKFSEKLFTQIEAWYRIRELCSGMERLDRECGRNLALIAISQTSRMIKDGYRSMSIQRKLKNVVIENREALNQENVNGRDKKLAGLITSLPTPIYRLVYRAYSLTK